MDPLCAKKDWSEAVLADLDFLGSCDSWTYHATPIYSFRKFPGKLADYLGLLITYWESMHSKFFRDKYDLKRYMKDFIKYPDKFDPTEKVIFESSFSIFSN